MNGQNNQGGHRRQAAANNAPQGNVVQAPRNERDHPEAHLTVVGGVVANLKSKYRFSAKAIEALRGQFAHLLVDPSVSRLDVGGKHGFENHPHPVGAFQRSYFDDLIMYKYQKHGTILEAGASPIRTTSRYYMSEGRRYPWLHRMHLMNPIIGAQDEERINNHTQVLKERSDQHQRIENLLANPWLWGVKDNGDLTVNQCRHAMRTGDHMNVNSERNGACRCMEVYDSVKSVESWYYPGVRLGMHSALKRFTDEKGPGKFGWIVGNDYFRMVKEASKSGAFREHLKECVVRFYRTGSYDLEFVGEALEHVWFDGKERRAPESRHIITSDKSGFLSVTAIVNGNAIPYHHKVPLSSCSDTFCYEEKDKVIMYQKMEQFDNGDIPFVLYKLSVTKKESWTPENRMHLEFINREFATVDDLITPDIVKEALDQITEEVNKKAVEDAKEPEASTEHDILLFNEELYVEKVSDVRDKRLLPDTMRSKHETNWKFIRWIQTQVDSKWYGRTHKFCLKYIKKEAYLVAKKYQTKGLTGLFGFNTNTRSMTAMAKLSDVLEAYLAIGVKTNTTSIQNTLVQKQRDTKHIDHNAFAMCEAYIIARLLRDVESKRFERIVSA